jgi:phosphoribosylformylglycinamidine synthase PurS subunit
MPKDGVSDPQGEAVKGGLLSLGHSGVNRVRVGRHIEVSVEADSADAAEALVTTMAEQLLANLVIEQFSVGNATQIQLIGAR